MLWEKLQPKIFFLTQSDVDWHIMGTVDQFTSVRGGHSPRHALGYELAKSTILRCLKLITYSEELLILTGRHPFDIFFPKRKKEN